MKNIAVIGAGLSGTLLVINLLKQKPEDKLHICWIDRESEDAMGPAYSTDEDYLLNVPVEKMGALSKDPRHFLAWARSNGVQVDEGDYLSRRLYHKYIKALLSEALKNKDENINLERLTGEVEDINISGKNAVVSVKGYADFAAVKVVLALGNAQPQHPVTRTQDFINDKRYLQMPWKKDLLDALNENDSVFFIGTGQTTVDLAVGLFRKKHKGLLTAISRRGVLPMEQKRCLAYPDFYDELKELTTVPDIFGAVRKHCIKASEMGMDAREVIDSLRPYTSMIWVRLPSEEKKRFMRHASRYWEVIRSRIPPESSKIINELISSGRLSIIAGRITDIIPEKPGLEVFYKKQKEESEKMMETDWVVNCMGPNLDYDKIDQKLIKNLISKKLVHCDPVHLGIDAHPDGLVITGNETQSGIFYTIGPLLKGILWETVAAPEIRLQAERLSDLLTC